MNLSYREGDIVVCWAYNRPLVCKVARVERGCAKYVLVPLSGSRRSRLRKAENIISVRKINNIIDRYLENKTST